MIFPGTEVRLSVVPRVLLRTLFTNGHNVSLLKVFSRIKTEFLTIIKTQNTQHRRRCKRAVNYTYYFSNTYNLMLCITILLLIAQKTPK